MQYTECKTSSKKSLSRLKEDLWSPTDASSSSPERPKLGSFISQLSSLDNWLRMLLEHLVE